MCKVCKNTGIVYVPQDFDGVSRDYDCNCGCDQWHVCKNVDEESLVPWAYVQDKVYDASGLGNNDVDKCLWVKKNGIWYPELDTLVPYGMEVEHE